MGDNRDLIVVDTETTGLDVLRHFPIEVAAVNVTTGEEFYFVPAMPESAFGDASPKALSINRYFEREVFTHRGTTSWYQLWQFLKGNTFAGCNPAFDAIMLLRGYMATLNYGSLHAPWHYRLADLSCYAAAALKLPPTELPGLAAVCELLDVKNDGEHTALGDARATAECFRRLIARATGEF